MESKERKEFREIHIRKQEGYRISQRLRDRDLIGLDTPTALAQLFSAFNLAAEMPMRPSSGLIEYYMILMTSR